MNNFLEVQDVEGGKKYICAHEGIDTRRDGKFSVA